MCVSGGGCWGAAADSPISTRLSQIYICVNSHRPHPHPNRSSISPGCKPDFGGNSRGAACHRAISTQGRGSGRREQSEEWGAGREVGRRRRELGRMEVGWEGRDKVGWGEWGTLVPKAWPQRVGPWGSPGSPAPSLANARADGEFCWAPAVQELLESHTPEPPNSGNQPPRLPRPPAGSPSEPGGSRDACGEGPVPGPQLRDGPLSPPVRPTLQLLRAAREAPPSRGKSMRR